MHNLYVFINQFKKNYRLVLVRNLLILNILLIVNESLSSSLLQKNNNQLREHPLIDISFFADFQSRSITCHKLSALLFLPSMNE